MEEKDFDLARRLLHTLKGLAGTIGAMDLADKAGKLEQGLVGDQKTLSHQDIAALKGLLKQAILGMNTVVKILKDTPEDAEPHSMSPDSPLCESDLDELEELLKEDDYEAHSVMEEIAGREKDENLAEDIKRLKNLIEDNEYSEALGILSTLRKKLKGGKA